MGEKTKNVLLVLMLTVQLDPLEQFLADVKSSAKDLAWIRNAANVKLIYDPIDSRVRRSPDNMKHILANFNTLRYFDEETGETEDSGDGGDAWYASFRSMECKNGNCKESKVKVRNTPKDKKKEKKKYRFRTKNSPSQDVDYVDEALSNFVESNSPQLNSANDMNKVSIGKPNSRKSLDLKDQLEHTKNDLSHEADYKLSKVEQETMGKRSNITWPLRNPDHKLSLISASTRLRNPRDPTVENQFLRHERSLNPINEIKLKVSNRMMERGFGASLPSENLNPPYRRKTTIDEILAEGHAEDAGDDPWKQDDSESEPEVYRSRRKMLQFDEDYALLETERPVTFRKPTTEASPATEPSNNLTKPATFQQNSKPLLSNKTESETVEFKIGLTINATLPANCSALKNNSTAKKKLLEKRAAAIVFPQISLGSTKQTNDEVRETLLKTYQQEGLSSSPNRPLDDLITGKTPSRVINAVFMLARNNARFRNQIWPGLKKQQDNAQDAVSHADEDLSVFQNEDNAAQIQHTEDMLREVMENLNNIIEQQIETRSCIRLRPDLQAFYEQIVESRLENDRIRDRSRFGRQDNMSNSNHIRKREAISESEIKKRSNVVKKLLQQYDYLSVADQAKVAEVKNLLDMHDEFLKDLERNDKMQTDEGGTN